VAKLELTGIGKRFGSRVALAGVSLAVEEGELLVLVGPSGCGKSTLLRIVAGLAAADEGSVVLDGRPVDRLEPRERDVAMVFQSYALYPHKTVRANLAFPLQVAGRPRAEIDRRVAEVAGTLGLSGYLEQKPATLSGGQMQRVALGRALIRNPRVFLFDEPLSNLDAKLRAEMRSELARLHARLGITTLYVTHDQAEAMTLGRRICVLESGRIQQVGDPLSVYERPATAFVAGFLGSPPMNLLRGAVSGGRWRSGPLELPVPSGVPDGELAFGVRAHEVVTGSGIALPVAWIERLGDRTWIDLDVAGQRLRVSREGTPAVRVGEALAVAIPPDRRHWFDVSDGHRVGG